MIAIVIAAFLFQPFRERIQARLDRFFYRTASITAVRSSSSGAR